MKFTWQKYDTQWQALDATEGASVTRVLTGSDLDHYDSVVGWELSDGRRVEMGTYVSYEGCCDTCSYETVGYNWYVGTPAEA